MKLLFITRYNIPNDHFSDTLVGTDLVRPTLMGQGQAANGIEPTQDQLSNISLASPPPSFPKNAHVF